MPMPPPRFGFSGRVEPRVERRHGRLTEIEADRCWSLLDTTTVGRLGFSSPDGIVILPVNFIVFESAVYFRTNPGTTIAQLCDGCSDVAFEVDHHEDMFQRGWSVLVAGRRPQRTPVTRRLHSQAAPGWGRGRLANARSSSS